VDAVAEAAIGGWAGTGREGSVVEAAGEAELSDDVVLTHECEGGTGGDRSRAIGGSFTDLRRGRGLIGADPDVAHRLERHCFRARAIGDRRADRDEQAEADYLSLPHREVVQIVAAVERMPHLDVRLSAVDRSHALPVHGAADFPIHEPADRAGRATATTAQHGVEVSDAVPNGEAVRSLLPPDAVVIVVEADGDGGFVRRRPETHA
jgi:hypothetical protein